MTKFHVDWEEENYDIEMKNLTIGEIFDDGFFSKTHKGELKIGNKKKAVLVKSAANPDDKIQQTMISDEERTLIELKRHPHILEFIGSATDGNRKLIVFEYPEGENLLEFVRTCRQEGTFNMNIETEENDFVIVNIKNETNNQPSLNIQHSLCTSDLVSIALQLAKTMQYLASQSYVHRQLRLSSIIIQNDPKLIQNRNIRIGEFGLARKSGEYIIVNKENPLPHHWMAPENFESHKFTEMSDVWSYAVCLWELFTLGKMPYEDVGEVLMFLSKGRRLHQPDYCSKEIYDFMRTCWNMDPAQRPTFSKCVDFFQEQMKKQTQVTSQTVGNNN